MAFTQEEELLRQVVNSRSLCHGTARHDLLMSVLQGDTWLARHAHVLLAVQKARSGADLGKALLFVERMLVEQSMLQPDWEAHFQAPWRKALAKCTDPRQAILYLAAVQVPHTCSLPIKTDLLAVHTCIWHRYTASFPHFAAES